MGIANYYAKRDMLRDGIDPDPASDFDETAYWDNEFDAELVSEAIYIPVGAPILRTLTDFSTNRKKKRWRAIVGGEKKSGKFKDGNYHYTIFEFCQSELDQFHRFLRCYPHI